jgi:dimeric dUTPase (all-alpha-NTP-PPase superfamily)
MNETNILASVEVPSINSDFPAMYILQTELQARLNQLPAHLSNTKHMAEKCIYWGHCVRAEVEELMEWLVEQKDDTWIKELKMEAIDIVHFVFNLGIEIGITDVDIFDMENRYKHENWLIESERVRASTILLNSNIIEMINLLPWKTWKTYKNQVDLNAVHTAYEKVFISCLLLCNTCNLNKQATIDMYFAKNKVNHHRQDTGY